MFHFITKTPEKYFSFHSSITNAYSSKRPNRIEEKLLMEKLPFRTTDATCMHFKIASPSILLPVGAKHTIGPQTGEIPFTQYPFGERYMPLKLRTYIRFGSDNHLSHPYHP